MFGSSKNKEFKAEPQIKELGCKVHDSFKQASYKNIIADKNKIILVIESFHELYKKKTNDTHDCYYIGNLIRSRIEGIEGKVEDVIGTVEQAVNRTIEFINKSEEIHSSQCEFFSRNLKVVLEKETFIEPPIDILQSKIDELNQIASGKVA